MVTGNGQPWGPSEEERCANSFCSFPCVAADVRLQAGASLLVKGVCGTQGRDPEATSVLGL